MEPVLIDNEWLAVTLSEGFSAIESAELQELMGIRYSQVWGVRDTNRHMLINVTWKDTNKLLTKLVREKARAEQIDKSFSKCHNGKDYTCRGFFERTVRGASAQAQGFGFCYTVEGVSQEGEVLVFKRGIRCYTLCYYTRSEVAEANRPTYEDILESLEVR